MPTLVRIVIFFLVTFLHEQSRTHAACPYANEFRDLLGINKAKAPHRLRRPTAAQTTTNQQQNDRLLEEDGLKNADKGCWGHCDKQAGDCDYCGTGQCCRRVDYATGVEGCELANNVSGAKCGAFRGEAVETLKNEGKACRGRCNHQIG